MGGEVPIQGADCGGCRASEGTGSASVRDVRDKDSERGGEQGPRTHLGECTTEHGTQRDHEADQRQHSESVVRGISASEEAVLGTTLLGARILLRHGRADDGGDDKELFGAPF